MSRNVLRGFFFLITVRLVSADSAERRRRRQRRRGCHLKKIGIVFILRIGWCRQRKTERDRKRERTTIQGR